MTDEGLRTVAARGIAWSVVQNWGGKILTFVLSILLARILSPSEFGIAAAAMVMLSLIPVVAGLGFGDAIMQRQRLSPAELNLPFYTASAISIAMVAMVVLFCGDIGTWLGVPGFPLYVAAIAGTALLTAPTLFQEAVFKRNMKFRSLATRTLVANLTGGLAAVACALVGLGVWSFVVQAYVVTTVSLVWLWSRPLWLPTLELDIAAFRQMSRFGIPVAVQRLVDFVGTRAVDLIIVMQLGIVAYGIYTVASRLYLTVLQLLQGALYDVSLTVLSRLSSDRERLSDVYVRTTKLSSRLVAPVFVGLAAVSPELCSLLFGASWDGVANVAAPLLILGSVQCVQFMNGAFLSARGRPELTLITGIAKAASALVMLFLLARGTVEEMVIVFVASQLVATPLSFFFAAKELRVPLRALFVSIVPSFCISYFSLFVVTMVRDHALGDGIGDFAGLIVIGFSFFAVWMALHIVFDFRGMRNAASALIEILSRRDRLAGE